jgi:hypothetical protein
VKQKEAYALKKGRQMSMGFDERVIYVKMK